MTREREVWVDYIKGFACIFVVLGHFYQSMTKSGILPIGDFYVWFNQTIYTFHVPIFFICSGYLYQKYSEVSDSRTWMLNAKKKFVVLGVPYFVFTLITLAMKSFAGGAVNTAEGSWLNVLLLEPTAPYWYLYVLFFLFLLIPTMGNKKQVISISFVACALKLWSVINNQLSISGMPYLVDHLCENSIWFVGGMLIGKYNLNRGSKVYGIVSVCTGLLLSIALLSGDSSNSVASFTVGMFFCAGLLLLFQSIFPIGAQSRFFDALSKYTMPIYLMHTIFAAGLRIVLLAAGVYLPLVHLLMGITISFIGPVLATMAMERIWKLDFLLYPNKYIRFNLQHDEKRPLDRQNNSQKSR